MGRRILNRKEMRTDFEAAERRQEDEEDRDDTDEKDEPDEDEEDEEDEEEDEEEDAAVEEPVEPPKKKKKAPPKTTKSKSRSRAQKVVRLKVVWGVFNNSNQRVAVFDYPKKREAYDLADKLTADKKSTHFVQPVKEPMEEKKEEK